MTPPPPGGPLERLAQWADDMETRSWYNERNRLGLLACHVVIGWSFAYLFARYGVPSTWAYTVGTGPWAQLLVVGGPAIGATLLAAGLTLHRNLACEALGMGIMLGWDVTGLVIVSRYLGTTPGPLNYQLAFYGGFALLMGRHLWTLIALLWRRT